MIGTIVTELIKGIVTPENITAAVSFLKSKKKDSEGKLSASVQEVVKQIEESDSAEEVSKEVKDELVGLTKEALREQASQVYASCVMFFIEGCLSEEEQMLLQNVITGASGEWDDEEDQEKQERICDFMEAYIGAAPVMGEDCYIGEDYVSLNFLDYDQHIYCEEDMRNLADALNHFLGGMHVKEFILL